MPGWLRRLAAISWRLLVSLALGAVLAYVAIQLSTVTLAVIIGAIWPQPSRRMSTVSRCGAAGRRPRPTIVVCLSGLAIAIAAIVVLVLAFVPYVEELAWT